MGFAITLGNILGAYVSSAVGFGSGLVGAFIVGAIIYVIYAFITKSPMNLMNGAIFSVLVYISTLITNMISSATGFGGGIMSTIIMAIVLSMLWGYFGKGKSGISLGTSKPRRKSRKRRR